MQLPKHGIVPASPDDPTLTVKEATFVDAYLASGGDAIEAARIAGYSENCLSGIVYKLLRRDRVRDALMNKRVAISAKLGVTAEKVIGELGTIAFAKISDVVSWDEETVTPKALEDILNDPTKAHVVSAIAEISIIPGKFGPAIKVKMHDKLAALEKLVRILELSGPEKVEVNNVGGAIEEHRDRSEAIISRLARIAESRRSPGSDSIPESGGAVLPRE